MTNQSVGYKEADINSIGSEDPEPDTGHNSITLKLSQRAQYQDNKNFKGPNFKSFEQKRTPKRIQNLYNLHKNKTIKIPEIIPDKNLQELRDLQKPKSQQ